MKKILFVSDIAGTIDNVVLDENLNSIESLKNKLEKLLEIHDSEEVIFSLCTADNSNEYLKVYVDFFADAFNNSKIKVGNNFYARGITNDKGTWIQPLNVSGFSIRKPMEIAYYAEELACKDDIIAIYFSDDRPQMGATDGTMERLTNNMSKYYFVSPFGKNNSNIEGLSENLQKHIENYVSKVKSI